MDEMLGKLVKLIVMVPAEWLGILVDLCEKLASSDGPAYLENVRRVLRNEDVVWEKVKVIYTRLLLPSLPLGDGPMVEVHQKLAVQATYKQMFGGLLQVGETYDNICMAEGQIEQFIVEHLDRLQEKGWTLFLYKKNNGFLVAGVCRFSDGYLRRIVDPLSRDCVWLPGDDVRIVVPQRTIKPSAP